uniref:Orf146 n=1 Tax=Zancudomyces culisetae TaxID=1213189 RepID=Q3T4D2_ZANCU|nr:orf146 [Zancudomyces culisetae]AAW49482.1 orf146 [Zancudomyces culisetae]
MDVWNYLIKKHKTIILNDNQIYNYLNKIDFKLITELEDNISLYSYIDDDNNTNSFSNVAIAAYARIEIYKYKTINNNTCFYSDTDSVVLQKPLSDKLIGKEIGKMKLEYEIKRAIFISPKTYILQLYNGNYVSKIKGYSNNLTFEE